jgi:hypothetical protein
MESWLDPWYRGPGLGGMLGNPMELPGGLPYDLNPSAMFGITGNRSRTMPPGGPRNRGKTAEELNEELREKYYSGELAAETKAKLAAKNGAGSSLRPMSPGSSPPQPLSRKPVTIARPSLFLISAPSHANDQTPARSGAW